MGVNKRANVEATKRRAQVEKTFRFGVGVAVAVAIVGYAMVFIAGRYGQVHTLHVDPSGAEELKQVFFSGEPWLVQCVSDEVPLHAASFAAAKQLASSSVSVGSLRCLDNLPSGRNFFQRFGFRDDALPDKDHPLYFLFANLDPPKRPKGADLRNQTTIAAFAARESTPRVHALKSDKELTYHCIKRRTCVILAAAGDIDVSPYAWVAEKHRNVRLLTVNTNDYSLSFFEQAGITAPKTISVSEPKLFVLRSNLSEEEVAKRREQANKERAERDAAQRASKKGGNAPPPRKPSPPQPTPFGVYTHNTAPSDRIVDSLIASHVIGGSPTGDRWVTVNDPKATPLKLPETAADRARRERREEARRAHNARKHARENGDDEEVESTHSSSSSSSSRHDDRDTKEEHTTVEEVGGDLDLDDDDIVVTDDEE